MAPKINVKERFNDGEVDLSMSDLNEVPVKEILTLKRVHSLDLSNNSLKLLPKTFSSLISLTILDLSRNELEELPEDFGNLIKLRHLDLYHNQLQHLPLSFSKLTNLKWLDLKDNPLVPAVAKVAGLCIDTKACQTCAKNIVHFFSKLETQVTAELEMRDRDRKKQQELNQRKKQEEKKEKKKDKRKEKENVSTFAEEPKKLDEKISIKPKMDTNVSLTHKSITWFFKLLFIIVLCYFILIFIDLKSSENIYDFVKVKLIDDFSTVLNASQVWCQEFKQYVLNFYKKL